MTTTTHANFVIERRYDASAQRVFAAWSDPASKRAWFAEGEGWLIQSYELDFRERGTEKSTFRFLKDEETFGEKTSFSNETVFNEIVPNERIIFTYSMARNGVRFSVSLASVELSSAGAGTRMIFTEHATFFEGGDGAQMREAGWRELLDKLDAYLASASA
ncbi:MAG: SRPBCC family protein [Caulobacteraceae bacterium]